MAWGFFHGPEALEGVSCRNDGRLGIWGNRGALHVKKRKALLFPSLSQWPPIFLLCCLRGQVSYPDGEQRRSSEGERWGHGSLKHS